MVDGLQKYQKFLPLSEINLNDINAALEQIEKENLKLNFWRINEKLGPNQAWQSAFEIKTDVDVKKFLGSQMFIKHKNQHPIVIEKEHLQLFAYYCCFSEK